MHTILITGANRGLGLEMAKQYAEANWHVYACCRNPSNSIELQTLQSQFPSSITLFKLDVASSNDILALKNELQNKPIDILMNNAGILESRYSTFGILEPESWVDTFKINTIGPVMMIQTLIENVSASSKKVVANISSGWGSISENTDGGEYPYRASKAALNATVKNLSIEPELHNIIFVAIDPGWVQTDMGGEHAALTPAESVHGIRNVLDSLSTKDSGSFIQYDGQRLNW